MNIIVQFNAVALMFAGMHAMLSGTSDAVFTMGDSDSDYNEDYRCVMLKDQAEKGTPLTAPIVGLYAVATGIWLIFMLYRTKTFFIHVKSIAWVRNWAMIKKDKWYRRIVYTIVLMTLCICLGFLGKISSDVEDPTAKKNGITALILGAATVLLSLFSLYSPNAETILIGKEAEDLFFHVPFWANADRIWEIITDGVIAAKMGDYRLLEHYGMTADSIETLLKHVHINDDLSSYGISEKFEGAGTPGKVEISTGVGNVPAMAVSPNVGVIASLTSLSSFT